MYILYRIGYTKDLAQTIGKCNLLNKYSEELLDSRPNSKLEVYPLSAVGYCSFSIFKLLSIFVADFHPQSEDSLCQGDWYHVMVGQYLSSETVERHDSNFCW